jgi:hypothetical protein
MEVYTVDGPGSERSLYAFDRSTSARRGYREVGRRPEGCGGRGRERLAKSEREEGGRVPVRIELRRSTKATVAYISGRRGKRNIETYCRPFAGRPV